MQVMLSVGYLFVDVLLPKWPCMLEEEEYKLCNGVQYLQHEIRWGPTFHASGSLIYSNKNTT